MSEDEELQIAYGRISYLEDQVRGLQHSLAAAEALVFSHEGHIARLNKKIERRDKELNRIEFIAGQIPLDLDNETLRRALIRAIERQRIAEEQVAFYAEVTAEIEKAGATLNETVTGVLKKIGERNE
jgi:phage shock protein A